MRAARTRFASRFTTLAPRPRSVLRASEDYAEFGYHAASNKISAATLPWKTSCAGAPWSITFGSRREDLGHATKGLVNQRDLALAYTPGVAAACEEIVRDPAEARRMTARGNLIGVVTNGTAVLGLGPIGPLASKPVMEGKSVLFKKFAGIDCFDIEINERDPDKLVEIIAALEPTFGGINLEDIKAPSASSSRGSCASA